MTKYFNINCTQGIPLLAVKHLPVIEQIVYIRLCGLYFDKTHYDLEGFSNLCGVDDPYKIRIAIRNLFRRKLLKKTNNKNGFYTAKFEILVPDEVMFMYDY